MLQVKVHLSHCFRITSYNVCYTKLLRKAAYPSSLLMNAIPAIVAGVEEIVVCTPTPNNEINELLLAACHICNVTKAYKVGGASAIAAMAYGTQTILV